jgi:hypothetical protein
MLIAKPFPEDDGELSLINSVLDQVRGILGEHFDVGVIMLSKQNNEGMTSYHGTQFGNKFAVTGMVEAWSNGEFDDPSIECEMEDDDD